MKFNFSDLSVEESSYLLSNQCFTKKNRNGVFLRFKKSLFFDTCTSFVRMFSFTF